MAVTQYKIDGWQTEQGLPQNTVQSMYQTRDGYLWVGTGAGLSRFDGIRFATFESAAVPEIVARPIFGFMEDAEGFAVDRPQPGCLALSQRTLRARLRR